jgi:sugar transferase (PEP-CTERM/EpsH1 system associated)
MGKVLFLSHRIPYPPDKGEKIRAWNILKYLAADHDIFLGCLADVAVSEQDLEFLKNFCADFFCVSINKSIRKLKALTSLSHGRPLTLAYFDDRRLKRWVDRTLAAHAIDLIYVYSTAMAPYVIDVAHPHRVLDMVDIDSEKWRAYAHASAWPQRLVWAYEARTLFDFEVRCAEIFDRTFFVSDDECAQFRKLVPRASGKTDWVANGVDLERFSPDFLAPSPFPANKLAMVFTGNMDYRPNIDAVSWFADAVFPGLKAKFPHAAFYIVGANPTSAVRRLARRENVFVTGRVADTRPYLHHATLVVAPLRIAAGVQNKVLEAMAMAKPVLATSGAVTGIAVHPAIDVLIADEAAAMIDLAGQFFAGAYPQLGLQALRLVREHYSWALSLERLNTVLAARAGADST